MTKLVTTLAICCLPLLLQACATEPAVPEHSVAANNPVIDSIDEVTAYGPAGGMVIQPQFHFHDPEGRVIQIQRELLSSTAPFTLNVIDAVVRVPANKQRSGGVILGGWHCGNSSYSAHLRATLLTSDGRHSNAMEYDIHCNGG